MIITEKIKKSYDKYAQSYDAGTQLQHDLADKLIKAVQDAGVKFSRVLDIGCGTGYLISSLRAPEGGEAISLPKSEIASSLTSFAPRNDVLVGCDISFGMLNCAKNKIPSARYVQANALVLPFGNACFDLVVSNAAYQWVADLKAAFWEVKRVLKRGGKFYFSVFNRNTLWQLREACKDINIASGDFPDKDKVSSLLRAAGFRIDLTETFTYEKYYTDLWELLGVLKNIGSTSAENKGIAGLGWRKILSRANDLYIAKFRDENGIPATYEAFLVKATKGDTFS